METGRLRQEVVEQSRQAATSNIVTTEVTRLREEVVQLRGHNVSGTEASQYYSRTDVSAAVQSKSQKATSTDLNVKWQTNWNSNIC